MAKLFVEGLTEEPMEFIDRGTVEKMIENKIEVTRVHLGEVVDVLLTPNGTIVDIMWSDPEDIEISGTFLAKWKGTKVVRKEGSDPEDIDDGVLVVDSVERDQYAIEGYKDENLIYGVEYHYGFFPYTEDGVVTKSEVEASIILEE